MPSRNLVDRAIIDVSALRGEVACPDASLAARPTRDLPIEPEVAARARAENLALRQQLAVLKRGTKRPKLTNVGRAFWIALSRLWPDWRNALILVKPETMVRWHCKGFKLYWTWKSRSRGGGPRIDVEIRTLTRRMARENPT